MQEQRTHQPTFALTRGAFWAGFGPGLLWAAAAIGVSHLVQSTRAGADAGLALAWVILAALVFKYPFFEYGPRYAAATGESLVEGYRRIGRWALWLYLAITVATALGIQVAIVLFTGYLVRFAFGLEWSLLGAVAAVNGACILILALGRYRALDAVTKVILAALAVSTLFAAAVTTPHVVRLSWAPWPAGADVPFAFILALVGWMPSAIDIAVWSSLWTLAKDRVMASRASVAVALLDFRIGYVGTAVLAFAFLALGAGVMHGSETSFSGQGTVFAAQLVDLYARTLGGWLEPVVIVAVVTTMASTAVTVVDGFPRAIGRSVRVLRRDAPRLVVGDEDAVYWTVVALLAAGTLLVAARFAASLTALIDFVTIVSFLTAPVLGYLNLRVVTSPAMPAEARPGAALRRLSWVGLVLLGGTAIGWVVVLALGRG